MSGFLDDHDDFELARRLRRAAGATPDVYVAYDSVLTRVGGVRRRRRLVTTSAAGVVLIISATSYVVNLQSPDRTIKTAPATTADVPDTTEPVVPSTVAVPTTIADDGLAGGPNGDGAATTEADDDVDTTDVATTAPSPTTTAPVAPTLAPQTTLPADPATLTTSQGAAPAPTAPPAPVTTSKPKPKPQPTAPPTLPPTTAAPETTVPPTTVPPTTVPPTTVPPTTVPPTTVPPTTAAPEETVPAPVVPGSWVVQGNSISVVYAAQQLSWVLVVPAEGWSIGEQKAVDKKHLQVSFAAPDGTVVTVHVTVDNGKPVIS